MFLDGQPGFNVIGQASDGHETVRQVLRLKPDVVIMDVMMPELNGIDATRKICEAIPSAKVIILSMYASNEHVFRAFKAGASGYVLKEMAGEELVRAIETVRSGKRYICENISGPLIDDYIKYRLANGKPDDLEQLSEREREVLQLVAEGNSNKQISGKLSLSPSTVASYRSRMKQKLGIDDISELIKFAIRHGLTSVKE